MDKESIKFIQKAFKDFNKNVDTIKDRHDKTADALEHLGYDQTEYRKKRRKK